MLSWPELKWILLNFVGEVDALCLREPLLDLIIRNIQGARNPNDPNPNWGIVAATIRPTRAQAQQEGILKQLKVKDVRPTSRYSLTKDELCRMQNEDEDLKPFVEKKEAVKRGKYEVKFEKYHGIGSLPDSTRE